MASTGGLKRTLQRKTSMPYSLLDIDKTCLRRRRRNAGARAASVLQSLAILDVHASVVGALATEQFGLWSDVDFLIIKCPRHLKYGVEADIEAIMADIPFDTVYQEEVRPAYLPGMQACAKSAREILRVAA